MLRDKAAIYQVAKPYITKKEEKCVLEVLRSGALSLGPKYKEFEEKFAEFIGTEYACAVSSGTAGLHLAMIAADIKKGNEVITTPFSFISSANAILYVAAKPVFVDIEPETYNIDPSKIEKRITKKTKAILVVHIFGQSADMEPILKLAKKYRLKIIEDACESIAATYKGKRVGTFGESAVFAFYPNKQMTTGEGGMIVTDNKKIYDLCCSLRNQGRAENTQWLDHERLGYNYRIDEMSAALGVVQMEKIDFLIKARQNIARLYDKQFSAYSDIIQLPQVGRNRTHTYFVYVIRFESRKINRDDIMRKLKKLGIQTRAYLPSIHLFSFYKKMFGYKKGDFPVSEAVSDSSLAIPFYIGLKQKDIIDISRQIINVLGDIIEK